MTTEDTEKFCLIAVVADILTAQDKERALEKFLREILAEINKHLEPDEKISLVTFLEDESLFENIIKLRIQHGYSA